MPDRRELLKRARAMRHDPTGAERMLWSILRGRRLAHLKFRRQAPLGRYIADFACFDPRAVIEADGGQHADSDYDAARDAWFRAEGFRVMRFWNDQILTEPEGVVEMILAGLA